MAFSSEKTIKNKLVITILPVSKKEANGFLLQIKRQGFIKPNVF